MTPAKRYDAFAYAARTSRTRLDPQQVTRLANTIKRNVPRLVERSARPYIADALASCWQPGFFRDSLLEKSAGLAELSARAAHGAALGNWLFWGVVYHRVSCRRVRPVLRALTEEALLCAVAACGADVVEALEELRVAATRSPDLPGVEVWRQADLGTRFVTLTAPAEPRS